MRGAGRGPESNFATLRRLAERSAGACRLLAREGGWYAIRRPAAFVVPAGPGGYDETMRDVNDHFLGGEPAAAPRAVRGRTRVS